MVRVRVLITWRVQSKNIYSTIEWGLHEKQCNRIPIGKAQARLGYSS